MDIKLRNSSFKNSISKKLLILNIITFIVIVIVTCISVENVMSNPNNTLSLIAKSDKVYVELSQNTNRNIEEFTYCLGDENDINIVLADSHGNIKVKTGEVNGTNIDINEIQNNKLNESGDSNNFTKLYNIKIDNEDLLLVISKDRNILKDMLDPLVQVVLPIGGVLLILYLVTLKKLRELTYICDGVVKIGDDDFDYKLNKKSNDEFGILAHEINKMSSKLKVKVENEKNIYKFKNDIITNIAHDLRTPLTSLVGYIQLADNENLEEDQRREYVKRALTKAERIQILISELFEYSKLESGEVELEKSNINIIEMLEQCIGEYANFASKENLNIIKRYKSEETVVSIDTDLFIRVFENILENAIKYSEKNTAIDINVIESEDNIVITFKNISKEEINSDGSRLFERFYRVDESRNQEISGSGLGLFIAKSIVILHDGHIWIETENLDFKISVKLVK